MLFGKRVKPRQFNYQPRYYDPKKEERELRNAVMSEDDEKYVPGSLIKKGRMKRMLFSEEDKQQRSKTLVTRLIIFLVLLVLASYFLLSFTGFEVMIEAFRNR